MENLLTVQEVAEILRISVDTVYAWKAQKKIRAVPLSRKALRFREQDVAEFIQRSLVNSATQPPSGNKAKKQKTPASAKMSVLDGQVRKYIENAKKDVLYA
jgi:excisionase family DNA binding protein